jgi:SARP family transcriptional regulator, regulator of embCAB operon
MNTRLVSYRGGKIDLAFPVEVPRVTIGREDDNMIQLPHPNVSKHHAVILQTKGGWVMQDLHSANGVLVNGKRNERAELKDQDRVQIGPYEFYFETNVPSEDWVPSHIIDLSTKVHEQTILKGKPPGRS